MTIPDTIRKRQSPSAAAVKGGAKMSRHESSLVGGSCSAGDGNPTSTCLSKSFGGGAGTIAPGIFVHWHPARPLIFTERFDWLSFANVPVLFSDYKILRKRSLSPLTQKDLHFFLFFRKQYYTALANGQSCEENVCGNTGSDVTCIPNMTSYLYQWWRHIVSTNVSYPTLARGNAKRKSGSYVSQIFFGLMNLP